MLRAILVLALICAAGVLLMLARSPFDISGSGGAAATELTALDQVLGRPIVLYAEGELPKGFGDHLKALDQGTGALDMNAQPQSLPDTDVYITIQNNWTVFRQADRHVMHALMVEKLKDAQPDASFVWFLARAENPGKDSKGIVVILGNKAGLSAFSDFCQAVVLYDMARFLAHNPDLMATDQGPAARWGQCRADGWTSVADMPLATPSQTLRP